MIDEFQSLLDFANGFLFPSVVFTLIFLFALISITRLYSERRERRIEEKKALLEIDILRLQLEREVYTSSKSLTSDRSNFLDVNHLIIDSSKGSAIELSPKSFFKSLGVDTDKLKVAEKTAFVLTPHHPDFDETYGVIKETIQTLGFRVERGDDESANGSVLKHVLQKIAQAELVFANIDGRNPNVYYELGLAQCLGKRVFILTSEIDDVPFDLKGQRMIVWSTAEDIRLELTRQIARESIEKHRI